MSDNERALLALTIFAVAYAIASNLQVFLMWREQYLSKMLLRGDRLSLRNKLLDEEGIVNGRSTSA
jgi:hypothetical protein